MRSLWLACLAVLVWFGASAGAASALPVFAHRYGFECQQCHTTVPHLNAFGEYFREHGFKLPDGRGTIPVAVKVNLAYGSDADPSGLPKAVVDEIELLSGGTLGNNTNYFVEQYAVDGGRPGLTRDAWIQFNGEDRHLRAGQFSLPLPIDVESERPSLTHYAVYDQTVGNNTFNFFDPRLGIDASFSNEHTGVGAHLIAVHAYDRQTGTPRSGIDLMGTLSKTAGPLTLQAYRYAGQRNFAVQDRFWRQGYAVSLEGERIDATALLQTGNDTSADGAGTRAQSSGGFLETAYRLRPDLEVHARYEGTSDTLAGMQRQFVIGTVLRPKRNMRFTVEGVQNAGHRSLSAALLFAY